MVVLSREPGMSIYLSSPDDESVVTLLNVQEQTAAMLINRAVRKQPGVLDIRTLRIPIDGTVKVNQQTTITLVDLHSNKARLGVNAPTDWPVLRLEVYEAIKREDRGGRDDPGGGSTGSPVPRPPSPMPPALDVRLPEPPTEPSSDQ